MYCPRCGSTAFEGGDKILFYNDSWFVIAHAREKLKGRVIFFCRRHGAAKENLKPPEKDGLIKAVSAVDQMLKRLCGAKLGGLGLEEHESHCCVAGSYTVPDLHTIMQIQLIRQGAVKRGQVPNQESDEEVAKVLEQEERKTLAGAFKHLVSKL